MGASCRMYSGNGRARPGRPSSVIVATVLATGRVSWNDVRASGSRFSRGIAFIALLCNACTGTIDDSDGEELCTGGENQPPERPEVMAPDPGHLDIIADELVIRTSPFSDPDDGSSHAGTEFEIWRLAAGEPVIRVWNA